MIKTQVRQIQIKQILEFSKVTKVVFMGEILKDNPLDELIGILKVTKSIDIEKILDEKGSKFEG